MCIKHGQYNIEKLMGTWSGIKACRGKLAICWNMQKTIVLFSLSIASYWCICCTLPHIVVARSIYIYI